MRQKEVREVRDVEDCYLCEVRKELEERGATDIDWDYVLTDIELSKDEFAYEIDGRKFCSTFLGTVISLSPSGKYYLPFACSNVDPCPHCGGVGRVKNPNGIPALAEYCDELCHEVRMHALENYGPASQGKWPELHKRVMSVLENAAREWAGEDDCPYCDGLGSEEAAVDALWREMLEAEAEAHGGSLECGEGDPLDIFFVVEIEDDEENDEEE